MTWHGHVGWVVVSLFVLGAQPLFPPHRQLLQQGSVLSERAATTAFLSIGSQGAQALALSLPVVSLAVLPPVAPAAARPSRMG